MSKKISFFSLVMLVIASIDNVRNLPSAALFGETLIFFFVFSALFFLIPTALVAAELSAAFPKNGGVYHWVDQAFGKKWAMAAIWLQWINTVVWYPTMLSFIAGTLTFMINPALAENKTYLISCILVIFWLLTLVNLKGLRFSALFNTLCCLIGTVLPLLFLIALGSVWVFSGHPLQIHLSSSTLIPPLNSSMSWISLIAIMASFLGIELSGVHVNEIKNPQRNFPRAVFLACLFIFFTMLLGAFSIAFVLPEKEINLISGVMQVFQSFFNAFGLQNLTPVLTFLIVIGSMGMMVNWLISPAKGLLHAAEFGFLPPFFTRKNKEGVPYNILLTQAILVSVFCLVFLFQPSVNAFYWFLTALSTELYMIMYFLMFGACIKLHYKMKKRPQSFKIPGGFLGIWIVSLIGMGGCLTTIIVSFFPPGNIDTGGSLRYLSMIILGNILTLIPLLLFYIYKSRRRA